MTEAMKNYLIKEWDIQGRKVVLYDRPPAHFHAASPVETHEVGIDLLWKNDGGASQ